MYVEIRFLARAGQGAKSAAQIVAEAAMHEGKEIQAFPEYGPERTGAPISSYVRISDKKINTHEPVLAPAALVIFDPTLIDQCLNIESLSPHCVMIINSSKDPVAFKDKFKGYKGNLFTVSATHIALDELGSDKPNSTLLGALLRTTRIVKMESLETEFKKTFERKLGDKMTQSNLKCIKRGHEEVRK